MKIDQNPRLAIFETFKTKTNELTGEANRQRSIIVVLATQSNPAEKTRTAIAQRIAEENGVIWKNIYSGIFRDLDEILIPLGLVKEDGRLPLKRGPKALQEKGIPHYSLTPRGLIAALSMSEIVGREQIMARFFDTQKDEELQKTLEKMMEFAPRFTFGLFETYVRAYCEGRLEDLIPFSIENLKTAVDDSVSVQKEFLEGFLTLTKNDREKMMRFLEKIA